MNTNSIGNHGISQEQQISIIIPHYNNGYMLDKLLSSILAECKADTQIIVVDDNSSDMLAEYLLCKEKYKDRVEFYSNTQGSNSAGTCRNIGIDHANGKWLLFCDADDFLLPGWHDVLSGYCQNDFDVVFFPPIATELNSNRPSIRADKYRKLLENYSNGKEGAEIRLRTKFFAPWSKLIRTEFVRDGDVRFESSLYGNDVMFSIMVGLSMNSFAVSNQEIYCVTEGTKSLTKDKTRNSLRIRAEAVARTINYIKKRLTYREWLQTDIGIIPMKHVFKALRRGYGVDYTKSLIVMYHKHGVSILPLGALLYQIILLLWGHLLKLFRVLYSLIRNERFV